MIEREKFRKLSSQKVKFSLRARITVLMSAVVFGSILIAYGLIELLGWMLPATEVVPHWIQLSILGIFVALIAVRFLSRLFFDPIKALNEGMKKVADGDFGVRLDTRSSSVEIQEMFAGFNMMVKELNSTEILQSDFVSNVSHEFKTPINAIEGYTTLLQGAENINETEKTYVEKILFNTRRLSVLVSNILLLSKIENRSIQMRREEYGLDEQIRESIVGLEAEWEKKSIFLDVELENVKYNGNEAMMRHVWTNLIGNAIKFSPMGGTVKVTLQKQEERIVFAVEDEGPGLSEEAQKHLFDKFYQGDTSHKEEGNGLGLPLVKRILAIEDGGIVSENIEGGGCRFTVTLLKNK